MNKIPDFFSVVFCITVICLTIPATREPLIKFIKPLFESGASDDYKRKLLDEYEKKVNSYNQVNSYNASESRNRIDVASLLNDPNFMPGANMTSKIAAVADMIVGKTYQTVDHYAQLRGTNDYAESIAANQNFYLDEYGEVVNEKPNLSEHRYKLIIYGGDWAYQRH